MTGKEKAAPAVAAAQDGAGQVSFAGFKTNLEYITEFSPTQGTISALLRRGRENALRCKEIAQITGLSPRKVTLRICRERREGAPILSDSSGFWLAEDEAELLSCVRRLHARAGEIHATARALEKIGGR